MSLLDEYRTAICPNWCQAPHSEDVTLHTHGIDIPASVKAVNIETFFDENARRAGAYVDGIEFEAHQIPALIEALTVALAAAHSAA